MKPVTITVKFQVLVGKNTDLALIQRHVRDDFREKINYIVDELAENNDFEVIVEQELF